MVAKDLVWAIAVLTRRTERVSLKRTVVDVKLQINWSRCDP